LLEENIVKHAALAPKPQKKLMVDSDNLTAGQSLQASVEMANSMAAPEGTIEDLSRFQVTIHRVLAHGTTDWTNTVTGPPSFYALKTVDVVTAGKSTYVLDKNNRKLWESKLGYPAA
jgi:hypothetical protein